MTWLYQSLAVPMVEFVSEGSGVILRTVVLKMGTSTKYYRFEAEFHCPNTYISDTTPLKNNVCLERGSDDIGSAVCDTIYTIDLSLCTRTADQISSEHFSRPTLYIKHTRILNTFYNLISPTHLNESYFNNNFISHSILGTQELQQLNIHQLFYL